jgi:hypothetical protein
VAYAGTTCGKSAVPRLTVAISLNISWLCRGKSLATELWNEAWDPGDAMTGDFRVEGLRTSAAPFPSGAQGAACACGSIVAVPRDRTAARVRMRSDGVLV